MRPWQAKPLQTKDGLQNITKHNSGACVYVSNARVIKVNFLFFFPSKIDFIDIQLIQHQPRPTNTWLIVVLLFSLVVIFLVKKKHLIWLLNGYFEFKFHDIKYFEFLSQIFTRQEHNMKISFCYCWDLITWILNIN